MTYLKLKTKPLNGNFNNLLENIFTPFPSIESNDFNALHSSREVPVNINETKAGYEIELIAPGFVKEDFKINLDKQLLIISTEIKEEEKADNKKRIRREFKKGSFKRSFTVDELIDTESISAQYVYGILTLNLRKKEEVKAPVKQINID